MRDYAIRFSKLDSTGCEYTAEQPLPNVSGNEMLRLAYEVSEKTGGSVTIIDDEGEEIISIKAEIGENVA